MSKAVSTSKLRPLCEVRIGVIYLKTLRHTERWLTWNHPIWNANQGFCLQIIFSLLITALQRQFSASHTQDWAQYRLATWQFCSPCPCQLCFVLFRPRPEPFPRSLRYRQAHDTVFHWMHITHSGMPLKLLAALNVSVLTFKVTLDYECRSMNRVWG